MKKILVLLPILAVLLAILYFLMPYVRTPGGEPVTPATTDSFQLTTGKIQEDSETYTVNAQYPQFAISSIDAQIRTAVEDVVAEFKTLPANPPESATPKNEFTGTFDSVYVGSDVVSVKLILSQYTGGAHPMTLFSGVNYDRATGRQLFLEDALALIGKSVAQVSAEATAQLKVKLGDSMFEEGANSNPENFSSFLISADTVTFIFQQYQVAAYAAGPQEVSFPRK